MKKTLRIAVLAFVAALFAVACGPKSDIEGFTKTDSGLHYKFITETDGLQPQDGDVLLCNLSLYIDEEFLDSIPSAEPVPLFMIGMNSHFAGDLDEGLKMMHEGDEAIFAVNADSLAKVGMQMPPQYKEGSNMTIRFKIKLGKIKPKAEVEKEQAELAKKTEQAKEQEPELIKNYVAEKGITQTPTKEGLYIIVTKKGNGPKVADGKHVSINYTGRLLDGTVFDSSDKNVNPQAHEPIDYVVGQQPMIKGWDMAVATLHQGDKATVIIPSELAYGQGDGHLPPYSTLVFDLEVLSVK